MIRLRIPPKPPVHLDTLQGLVIHRLSTGLFSGLEDPWLLTQLASRQIMRDCFVSLLISTRLVIRYNSSLHLAVRNCLCVKLSHSHQFWAGANDQGQLFKQLQLRDPEGYISVVRNYHETSILEWVSPPSA